MLPHLIHFPRTFKLGAARAAAMLAMLAPAALSTVVLTAPAAAQSGLRAIPPVMPRITQAIDESARVTVRGTVHPLARPESDLGPAEDALSGRMLLVLKRGPEQDRALRQFLDEQQTPGSPNFHKWLTPDEFGQKFGVADADIETVTGYLAAHGFQVGRTYKNKTLIEVTGTAAQLRDTFHAEIHRYSIGGQEFFANATEQQVPAALAPVVRGFASLNNLNLQPQRRAESVPVEMVRKEHGVRPEYYISTNGRYGVGPADAQTIYNIPVSPTGPGKGGTGVTVGVIGQSQIDLLNVTHYQALGGAGTTTPIEIVDGEPPAGNDTIGLIQLELIGAAAPYANLNYYVSAGNYYDNGLTFAIIRAVEDDAVSVLSMAYSTCEANLGAVYNGLVEAAWMQAAAQGITVVAAAGDNGPAGCDAVSYTAASTGGLAVNGYASTAYDTSVGGTDFYYAGNPGTYWSTTNGTNGLSAKSYIPEQALNDNSAINTGNLNSGTATVVAGSGGLSTLGSLDGVTSAPYAIPSWQVVAQTNAGTAGQGARAIPDVALFAGSTANNAAYLLCLYDSDCLTTGSGPSPSIAYASAIGGTPNAVGLFAGIMADVAAQWGPQGNVNPALYGMASTAGIFHDVIRGSTGVVCTAGTGCSGGYLQSNNAVAYAAKAGYDLATGLGSVNATNLINGWKLPATKTSTTQLAITNYATGAPVTGSVVHGTPLNLSATVTSSGGTPTGNVAFTTGSLLTAYNGIYAEPLVAGVATSANNEFLPGGSYKLTARYAGDGTFLPSTGTQAVTITPEPSHLVLEQANTVSGGSFAALSSGKSVTFGTSLQFVVEPWSLNRNNVSTPTGTVSVYPNALATAPAFVLPVDSEGTATLNTGLLFGGSYSWVFRYSGDASFQSSDTLATPFNVTVTTASTTTGLQATGVYGNAAVTLTATVAASTGLSAASTGVPPTGTVTFSTSPSQPVTLSPGFNSLGQAIATATLQVPFAQVPSGAPISATYNGDSNYAGSIANTTLKPVPQTYTGSSTLKISLSANPVTNLGPLTITGTATDTNSTGPVAPLGTAHVFANSVPIGTLSFNNATTATLKVPLTTTASGPCMAGCLPFASGNVVITAVFVPSNTKNAPSTASATLTVTDNRTSGDFALTVDSTTANITSSSNVAFFQVQLTDLGNLTGLNSAIALTCTVPGNSNLTCLMGGGNGAGIPADGAASSATVNLGGANGGTVVTQLSISGAPAGGTGALRAPISTEHWWLLGSGPALACIVLIGIPARRKGLQSMFAALVCIVLVCGSVSGCAGNPARGNALSGGNLLQSGAQATANYTGGLASNSVAPGTYTVVITGTNVNNATIVHNVSLTVTVSTGVALANGTYHVALEASSQFLTDPGASSTPGTGMVQDPADTVNPLDQQWTFTYQNNGYYTIQNAGNGLYLTDPGGAASHSGILSQDTPATLQTAINDGTQLWTLNAVEDQFEIVNAVSGGVLDVYNVSTTPGTGVIVYPQTLVVYGIAQGWYIQ